MLLRAGAGSGGFGVNDAQGGHHAAIVTHQNPSVLVRFAEPYQGRTCAELMEGEQTTQTEGRGRYPQTDRPCFLMPTFKNGTWMSFCLLDPANGLALCPFFKGKQAQHIMRDGCRRQGRNF